MQVRCPRILIDDTRCDADVDVECYQDSDGDADSPYGTSSFTVAISSDKCEDGHELTEKEREDCEKRAAEAYNDPS